MQLAETLPSAAGRLKRQDYDRHSAMTLGLGTKRFAPSP
jgi:hypothetical protein